VASSAGVHGRAAALRRRGHEHSHRRDELPDADLVLAMRRHESDAFHEFFARHAPMLELLAGTRRVPRAEREALVTEFLDDVAMRLVSHTTPVPRSLAAYLVVSFRRWHLNRVRDARRREELGAEHALETGAGQERAILGATSADAIRASQGPDHEDETHAAPIERLALAIENRLGASERQLLEWLGQRVPQRIIAEWLGVTHGAIRVRVTRLRRRLRAVASEYVAGLSEPERETVERFLRRGAGTATSGDADRRRPETPGGNDR
jgi:RNA polymerase sigma factor (sigma-70 family)